MSKSYDSMVEENIQLQSSLGKYKSIVDRLNSDNKTLQQMYSDLKENFDKIKKSSLVNLQHIEELTKENRDQEAHFELTIKSLQASMENKQSEIEELQERITPNLNNDYEMMKVKAINEISEKNEMELNLKNQEIDSLNSKILQAEKECKLKEKEVFEIQRNTEKALTIEKEVYTVYFL